MKETCPELTDVASIFSLVITGIWWQLCRRDNLSDASKTLTYVGTFISNVITFYDVELIQSVDPHAEKK